MSVYIISYDLKKPGQDYAALYEELKKTTWWHYLESTWLLNTPESIDNLRKRLFAMMDQNDSLFIIELSAKNNYTGWLPQKAWDWIKQNLA
jgi:hypothetical protein